MSSRKLALALVTVAVAGYGSLMGMRGSLHWAAGDEGTYLAMAQSLARDADLLFTQPDVERVEAAQSLGERSLILQKTERGISYSKPIVYPLLAAPFTLIAGRYGPILLNLAALGVALWVALLYLRRIGTSDRRILLVTFVGTSALLPYLVWRMSDSLVASCVLAGLALALAGARRHPDRTPPKSRLLDGNLAPVLGGLLLGLAAAMRYPNALLALAAIAALLFMRDPKRALWVVLGLAIAAGGTAGLSTALTGAPDPYRAVRSTFDPSTGYPDSPASELATERFGGRELATVRLYTRPGPNVLGYSTLYFFIGRHTGLLIYFPAALLLAFFALRRPDAVSLTLLAAVVGIAFFYLWFLPHNYFGGAAAVGNRYFMATYPALLIAQREIPKPRWLAPAWALGGLVFLSALWSVWLTSGLGRTSQSHTHAGLFRLLPYESTLQSIDGSSERFWLHDWEWELLHFNDPYQRLGRFSFTLETGRPGAEIEIANTRFGESLRFLVVSGAPQLLLDYRDWRREETIELQRPSGASGLVEIEPSPPWRKHSFWFSWRREDLFQAHLIRLGIRTPDDSHATAEVRYLGSAVIPTELYSFELVNAELPTLAGAGTTSTGAVSIRNTSSETWKSERVLAVFLSYKLYYREEGRVRAIEGRRTRLPKEVPPGETVDAEFEIHWPNTPRNYGLAVDLIHEGISWFEQQNGSPVARSEVQVVRLPEAEPVPGSEEEARQ